VPKFLDRLFQRFRPVRRNDPIFGSMLYMGNKLKYWEGKARFLPSSSEIEVFVDGDMEFPFKRQYEFFERVCGEWQELCQVIAPALQEVFSRANSRPLAAAVWEEFNVRSISIPDSTLDAAKWTISLDAKSDAAHSYFVEMKGRVPEVASWDS